MATALYKEYLIFSFANQNGASKRWSVTVDISSRNRPSNTIRTGYRFHTREEAEQVGLEKARAWIDKQP